MNNAKTGIRDITDSLTPLKFNKIITIITKNTNPNFSTLQPAGRKLNIASTPLDIEIAIVST
ncbi:hypothetical protein SDC9_181396 [bioreactor metagenome]|uniref:Uncharacterized protein n=1 Tax=bioreactor metagenome TaxID=1076179 RepID=A0A645HCT2_9ZZZZ